MVLLRQGADLRRRAWYDFTISASDKEALTKPRDSREYVMDKVLEDLTFASTYCLPTPSTRKARP